LYEFVLFCLQQIVQIVEIEQKALPYHCVLVYNANIASKHKKIMLFCGGFGMKSMMKMPIKI